MLSIWQFFWNKIKDITDLESAPFITFTVNKELRKTIDDYFNIKILKLILLLNVRILIQFMI